MAIGNAVQRGSTVYIYDEKGRTDRHRLGGLGPARRAARLHGRQRQRAARVHDLHLRRARAADGLDGGAVSDGEPVPDTGGRRAGVHPRSTCRVDAMGRRRT